MAAAKAVWRSSSGGGDRREPAWILGFKPKRTNLHEKYDYPSLREGLEETLTAQELGITGALYRTLRTTNPIENLNGSVARYCRNVKRWGDGQMVLRWVASALSDAAHRMRKLRGCSQMRSLLNALDARCPPAENATLPKAA